MALFSHVDDITLLPNGIRKHCPHRSIMAQLPRDVRSFRQQGGYTARVGWRLPTLMLADNVIRAGEKREKARTRKFEERS